MQQMTDGQFKALKRAEEGVWARTRAYIILHPELPGKYGKIKVAYPTDGAGTLRVWVWDTEGFAGYGNAKGCGYDKLSAALADIEFNSERLEKEGQGGSGGWENNLRNRGYEVIRAI